MAVIAKRKVPNVVAAKVIILALALVPSLCQFAVAENKSGKTMYEIGGDTSNTVRNCILKDGEVEPTIHEKLNDGPARQQEMQQIDPTVLFGDAEHSNPRLSPDGMQVAFGAQYNGKLHLWVCAADGSNRKPVVPVEQAWLYAWAYNNEQLLYRKSESNECFQWFAVDLSTGKEIPLTPADSPEGRPLQARWSGIVFNENQSSKRPDEILVGLNMRESQLFDAWLINTRTAERTLVAQASEGHKQWLVDNDLNIRGAVSSTSGGGVSVNFFDQQGNMQKELSWGSEDATNFQALNFDADNQRIYILDPSGKELSSLYLYNPGTGQKTLVLSGSDTPILPGPSHPITHKVDLSYSFTDTLHCKALDETMAEALAGIRQYHDRPFVISDRSKEDDRWLIGFLENTGIMEYNVYHRQTGKFTRLFADRPQLESLTLSPTQPISFQARDGLEIHGYLTIPPSVKQPGPLVLLVHGGPWTRDYSWFDPEVQWLANHGYACLQVNFRGSTGYGSSFTNAGNREWGLKMQDDLTDAVRWAIGKGIAEPRRVAIMGDSYGGYAALAGVTLTPDLYAGAISLNGISNIELLLSQDLPAWAARREEFAIRIGRLPRYKDGINAGELKPESEWTTAEIAEMKRLRSTSPINLVDQIKVPVLIAHGLADPRAVASQSTAFVAEMERLGLPHEYVVYENEGHGFSHEENRIDFYTRVVRFLAEVIGE